MKIPLYFDYACPWAYLGSSRAEAYFGELGVEIDFKPALLSVLREPSFPAPEMGPRKQRHYMEDLRRWSEMIGARIHPDARHLVQRSTRLALAAALVAKEAGVLREFHHPAYRARWAEARDLSDRQTVRELLAGAGLDADAALARAESAEIDAQLIAETHAAIERGVFGVPTLIVGDQLLWGNDRFELARFYVQKELGAA